MGSTSLLTKLPWWADTVRQAVFDAGRHSEQFSGYVLEWEAGKGRPGSMAWGRSLRVRGVLSCAMAAGFVLGAGADNNAWIDDGWGDQGSVKVESLAGAWSGRLLAGSQADRFTLTLNVSADSVLTAEGKSDGWPYTEKYQSLLEGRNLHLTGTAIEPPPPADIPYVPLTLKLSVSERETALRGTWEKADGSRGTVELTRAAGASPPQAAVSSPNEPPPVVSEPAATPAPVAKPAHDLTGEWTGQWTNRGKIMDFVLRVRQDDAGKLAAEGKANTWSLLEIFEGTVEGDAVTLTGTEVRPAPPPGKYYSLDVLHLTLSEDGRELAGNWEDADQSTGAIRVTRRGAGTADGIVVRCPSEVSAGEPVTIEIEAVNPDTEPRIGTIAVSVTGRAAVIPERKGSYDLFLPGGKSYLSRFEKEGDIWRLTPQREKAPPAAPHVEVYDAQWGAGESKRLSFQATFPEAGTARIYVRATFSRKTPQGVIIDSNLPPDGEPDEQGLPCMVVRLSVL